MPLPHGDRTTRYSAERRLREGAIRGVLVAAGLVLGGCGAIVPLGPDLGFVEPLATGSLPDARPSALDLPPAAFTRASAALAEALDPLGPGDAVAWDDPESGARGAIAAAAGPTVEDDLVCRRFSAESTLRDRPSTRHVGHACRIAAGMWRIESATPAPGDESDRPPPQALPAELMPDLPG